VKIKAPKKSWAERRLQTGPSYVRNAVGVNRRGESAAEVRSRMEAACPVETSNDKFNPRTKLFENKGRKDGRCNRTACQRRIGNHPELPAPRPQFVMERPYSSHDLFYCQRCHEDFVTWDRQIGQPDRTRLYVEGETNGQDTTA
jgi:hypothetical protein